MQQVKVRVIPGEDVRRLLSYEDCVPAVDSAMRAVSAGRVAMPLRTGMPLPSGAGVLGMMPGYLGDPDCFGIKLVSLFPGNQALGLSSHLGLYLLYEARNGRPVAMLEAGSLTAIRTAAASVVATRALARREARTLALIGTGEQAVAHLEAFQSVRPFDRIVVWGRRSEATARLADHARSLGDAAVEVASDVREALRLADVVCTVTSAREPVLRGADVRAGTHLCLVGASFPDRREVDDDCVARSRYYVDYRGSALAQAGELLHAIGAGRVSESHIVAEIGEVLDGRVPGRRADEEITVYRSLGVAAQDLAAATLVLRRAEESGAGTVVGL